MATKDLFTTLLRKDKDNCAWIKMIATTLCVWTVFLQSFVRSEVYSSASDMKNIFSMEMDLANSLNDYATKTQAKLDRINKYIQDFNDVMKERALAKSDDDLEDMIIGNPIHAYKTVKRFAIDLKKIEQDLQEDDWKETEFQLKKRKLGSVLPRDEDLHGTAQAIIRLQDTYELDIRDFAEGEIGRGRNSWTTTAKLSAQDCLFMGKHCYNAGRLSRSLEWFEEAWYLAGREGNETLRQDQVHTFLDHAAKQHDERVLKGERGPNLFPKPVHEEPPFQQRETIFKNQRIQFHRNLTLLAQATESGHRNQHKLMEQMDLPRFKALCRGEELRPLHLVGQLKCHFDHRDDPFFLLQPIMVEKLHYHPVILMFHDIVSPREMKTIRIAAAPLLKRSQVQGHTGLHGDSLVSLTRTSKTGWLPDSFHPVVEQVTDRSSQVTKLNANTWRDESELLQVANYINGGHYNPHHDYVMKDKDPNHMIYLDEKREMFIGDRIATLMFYINNVPAGGRTVFPRIGVGVKPNLGSALFWYNLHETGEPDRLTLHGACPVLFGTKWVANKWIREGAQAFLRRCPLNKNTVNTYQSMYK